MCSDCCKTSCWCAPCRWMSSCFTCCKKKPVRTAQYAVNQVSIAVLGTPTTIQPQAPPSHHRERTWKLSSGRMTYDHD